MFYESERIIRKNKKYVKSKAYQVLDQAQQKGMSYEEIVYANECALSHTDILNETQVEILTMVRDIAKTEMENDNDETTSEPTSTSGMLGPSTRTNS